MRIIGGTGGSWFDLPLKNGAFKTRGFWHPEVSSIESADEGRFTEQSDFY
jgi:hypothetical protein